MQAFNDLQLRTNRLVLRPLQEPDADALYSIFSDEKVMRYWSTPPWTNHEPALAMIAKDLAQISRDHLRLGIVLSQDECLIGTCTF